MKGQDKNEKNNCQIIGTNWILGSNGLCGCQTKRDY